MPGFNIATGVSSACNTAWVSSAVLSASTKGCSRTPQAPTHCAKLERGSARPARPKMPSCRYSGW